MLARHRGRLPEHRDAGGRLQRAVDGFKAAALYVANWFFIAPIERLLRGQTSRAIRSSTSGRSRSRSSSTSSGRSFWAGCSASRVASAVERRTWCGSSSSVALLLSLANALRLAQRRPRPRLLRHRPRAYQLLAGALLALTPSLFARAPERRRSGVWCSLAGIGALVALFVASTSIGVRRPRHPRRHRHRPHRDPHRLDGTRPRRRSFRAVVEAHRLSRSHLVRHLPLALAHHPDRDPRVRSQTPQRCSSSLRLSHPVWRR